MNLVIVGEFDSTNVGDQLIAEGQREIFAACCERARLLPLESVRSAAQQSQDRVRRESMPRRIHRTLYSQNVIYRHAVESVLHARKSHAYRLHAEEVLAGAEGLIIGGGQLLSDGTLRMLRRLDAITELAKERGIPVAAFGTGMGQARSRISRALIRRILHRLDGPNFFRDERSRRLALELHQGIRLSPTPTPDCAIAGIARKPSLMESPVLIGVAPMAPAILARSGIPTAGVDHWWVAVIERLLERGETPVLFSTGVGLDADYAKKLQEELEARGRSIDLLDRPKRGEELLGQLRLMKRVLAQRLHASIAYYALGGIPASATWDAKVDEFYASISLDRRVICPDKADPEDAVRIVLSADRADPEPEVLVGRSLSDASQCVSLLAAWGG